MWELDCEEGWALKNWCFWTVVLEKTLESLLDSKEIQPVHSKDQSWVFFGRNDAKAETLVFWPPYAKSWLLGKDSDAGRVWGQEEKGTTEDEMAGWHHWLDRCESWTTQKAECQRFDAFELWCWRGLLRVPWSARRWNQLILKEINPEYSLEGLIMKLKLHYFGHLMRKTYSLEKTMMLGKTEGRRRRGWQRMRWLDGITNLMDMSLGELRELGWTGRPGVLQFMGSLRAGHD